MTTPELREEFEASAKHFSFDLKREGPEYVAEPYVSEYTDWAWLAWQAARASHPTPPQPDAGAEQDAKRYRWLTDDLPLESREKRFDILDRMSVMSHSAVSAAIDAAMAAIDAQTGGGKP